MNLAGDYASACHEVIHHKIAKAIGAEVLSKVENHHNFAWKEKYDGESGLLNCQQVSSPGLRHAH